MHALLKWLYGGCLGLVFVTLGFFAPNAWGLVSKPSPEAVQPSPTHTTSRHGTSHRSRGPRYVFVGGYGRK
jgi:hypothetical protein